MIKYQFLTSGIECALSLELNISMILLFMDNNWIKSTTGMHGAMMKIKNLLQSLLFLILFASTFTLKAQQATIDFDTPQPSGGSGSILSGVFDGVNWGNNQWRWESAFNVSNTNHIYFHSGSGQSRQFSFASGSRILQSIKVFSVDNGTLTLTDNNGQSKQQSVSTGSMQTITTGWDQGSATVTVKFSAGWSMGIDDVVHRPVSTSPPPPPPSSQFTLSTTQTGSGQGTVTSSPAGINCGSNCSAQFDEDSVVTLTATPSTGSLFDGWSGHADCNNGVVTMSEDISCTATFSIVTTSGDAGSALQFFGNGIAAPDRDRVKILIDGYGTGDNSDFPVDVGAEDFTIEFWMNASAQDNNAGAVNCGANENWIRGNIVLDRDRYNQGRKYGLSIAGSSLVFGVSGQNGQRTICGTTSVVDGNWHHVVIQRRRSDGLMQIYVDGFIDAEADGPNGDISYPDNAVPGNHCNGRCYDSDPYLVIGAEKHDAGAAYPSYAGLIDEMRISNTLRYSGTFNRPTAPFVRDANTLALYHFDEGSGQIVHDDLQTVDGPRDGVIRFGGNPIGPVWVTSDAPL